MVEPYTLYAVSHSLYSGRARSYLIKNGIPFRELSTGHESFKRDILPQAKLPTIPTLLAPDGEVIRDGAAIIEHFESKNGRPGRPDTPQQQIVSALFDLIGAEGLLRPAMHYRWNFPETNLDFVRYHFFYSQRDTAARSEKTDRFMDKMRHAAQLFGVSEAAQGVVEQHYMDFLLALDAHLAEQPYLLGWQPCIGDFGLLAPLFAHLGRDPEPLRIMQQKAVRVYRWVERMNNPSEDFPEFYQSGAGFLPDDTIPESLVKVLQVVAEDLVPETRAAATCINQWLDENDPPVGSPAERMLGMGEFELRGQTIIAVAQTYRFYLLQKVQDTFAEFDASQQAEVQALLAECGMTDMLSITLQRRVERQDNLEVWR